jgi:hypothetical protein
MILVYKTVIQLFRVQKANLYTFELTLSGGLLYAKCCSARGRSPSSLLWPKVQYTHEGWQKNRTVAFVQKLWTLRWPMLDQVTTQFAMFSSNSIRGSTLLTIWIHTVKFGIRLGTFRRNIQPTSSEYKIKPNLEKLMRIWEWDCRDTSPGEGWNNRRPLWRYLGRV